MGFNPYKCIVCHCVEDNGWQNSHLCNELATKFKLTCEDRDVHEATPDICNYCLYRSFAPKSQFFCVVCHKRANVSFGYSHLSFKIAQIHNAIYVAIKKIVLDVCKNCVFYSSRDCQKVKELHFGKGKSREF